MSQPMDAPSSAARAHLDKICSSIRGKLQFMDYLVRAAVADVERFQSEADPGTQIFLRQLIEMHAANLSQECENMQVVGDLCQSIEQTIAAAPIAPDVASGLTSSAHASSAAKTPLRQGGAA